MHSPAAQASVQRVASGDHSLDAIAQLLICLSECFESQSRKIDRQGIDLREIRESLGRVETRYDDCPARVAAQTPAVRESPKVDWKPFIKYGLLIVYLLVVIVATLLGVKVAV